MVKDWFRTAQKETRDRVVWGSLMGIVTLCVFLTGTPVLEAFILCCVWRLSYEWVLLKKSVYKVSKSQDEVLSIFYLGIFQSAVFLTTRIVGTWWALGSFCTFFFIIYLFSPGKYRNWNTMGYCYLGAILITSAWVLRYFKNGALFLLWVILIVTLVDISAYITGRYFKGPKFIPRISPNKTWSGVFGGIFGGIVGALFGRILCAHCSIGALIAFGFFLSAAAILGDLIESYLKRRQGVKDVQSIIPGHGGFLDRLDSLLIALPMAVIIIRIFPGNLPFVLLP